MFIRCYAEFRFYSISSFNGKATETISIRIQFHQNWNAARWIHFRGWGFHRSFSRIKSENNVRNAGMSAHSYLYRSKYLVTKRMYLSPRTVPRNFSYYSPCHLHLSSPVILEPLGTVSIQFKYLWPLKFIKSWTGVSIASQTYPHAQVSTLGERRDDIWTQK